MATRLKTATLWKLAVSIGVLGAMALLFSIGVWASGGTNPIKPGSPAIYESVTLDPDEEKIAIEVLQDYEPLKSALAGNEFDVRYIGPWIGEGRKIGAVIRISLTDIQDISIEWPSIKYRGTSDDEAVYEKSEEFYNVRGIYEIRVIVDLKTRDVVALDPIVYGRYSP